MSGDPGEAAVIDALLSGLPPTGFCAPGAGPGEDDCAVLPDGTAITADTLVEGVHFDHRLSPADVGWKAVAVNASDLGATGATPQWCTLCLSLPRPLDLGWVRGFREGLHEALQHFGLTLIGGDTTRSPGPRVVTLTAAGHAPRPVLRGGGRPGDRLWVTGALGGAAAGHDFGGEGLFALRRPHPPVAFGAAVGRAGLARAMMDLSDGLAADLPRLCARSGVGAEVDPAALPVHPALRGRPDPLPWMVSWGDDYELLIAAPPAQDVALSALAARHKVSLTPIGALTVPPGVHLIGRPWPAPCFAHFGPPEAR
jgi:thiamine-monophosphate kinase